MKKILLPALLFICMMNAHAQNKAIDSLQKVLRTAKEDTNKVNILNGLSWQSYQTASYDTALYYARIAMQLAGKLRLQNGIANAFSSTGNVYNAQGNYPEALKNHFAALKIREETGDKTGVANSYTNIGTAYLYQSNYPEALKNYFAALKIREETGDKNGIAASYTGIGNVYHNQGNYPEALKNHFAALKITEENGDKNRIANSYTNIGNVYHNQGNYTQALKNYFAALKINEETGDKNGIAGSYNNIANVYKNQDNYPGALKNYFAAMKINEETGNKNFLAINYNNIGLVYSNQGNYPEALENYFASLKIKEEIGDRYGIANSYNNIGELYTKLNKAKEGKAWLQKGLALNREIGAKEWIKNAYSGLAVADSAMGNYKGAYQNHKMYMLYRDSIYNEENTKKTTQLEMQFEFDKKEAVAKAEQEKKDAVMQQEMQRQKLVRNGFIGGFAVVLLFAGVFLRQRNKISREKKTSDIEKKRSDELLLNILPAEVAEELKETGGAAARHFDNVTVLFTDFVNFTLLAEKLSPQQLVDELHTCFKAFDDIISKYHIEKIKTIGDAYLAVCGLPVANPHHAENIINAALEIKDFMLKRRKLFGNDTFEIRIGIHSGSVVAGIVGVKKFAYDIWGDTVNTAARMEQNSEAGKINISEATYQALHLSHPEHSGWDKYAFTYRGEIEAKNKGAMKMYFVET